MPFLPFSSKAEAERRSKELFTPHETTTVTVRQFSVVEDVDGNSYLQVAAEELKSLLSQLERDSLVDTVTLSNEEPGAND